MTKLRSTFWALLLTAWAANGARAQPSELATRPAVGSDGARLSFRLERGSSFIAFAGAQR